MRLFVALLPDDGARAGLEKALRYTRGLLNAGTLTRPENLHLTLAFLGEVGDHAALRRELAAIRLPGFAVNLNHSGSFEKQNGAVLWLGCEAAGPLLALRNAVNAASRRVGLGPEAGVYRPHVTLARGARLPACYSAVQIAGKLPPVRLEAGEFALMQSHRVNGELTYTPLQRYPLDRPGGKAVAQGLKEEI